MYCIYIYECGKRINRLSLSSALLVGGCSRSVTNQRVTGPRFFFCYNLLYSSPPSPLNALSFLVQSFFGGVKMMGKWLYFLVIIVTFCVKSFNLVTCATERENDFTSGINKFTIQELFEAKFPRKISDDIYTDPCKAGTF